MLSTYVNSLVGSPIYSSEIELLLIELICFSIAGSSTGMEALAVLLLRHILACFGQNLGNHVTV